MQSILVDVHNNNRKSDSAENVQFTKINVVPRQVSVIIPVFNTPKDLLRGNIESITKQTYKNLDIIVVDDGSKSDCADFCDEISKKDSRIRCYHIHNQGVSIARNKGIAESKGEFITFVDSDDTLVANAIEIMVESMHGVDFVVCGCKHVNSHQEDNFGLLVGNCLVCKNTTLIEDLCYMNTPFDCIETNAVWGKLYRREIINELKFSHSMVMAEDFKFNFDYIARVNSGKYVDFVGYNYLVRSDSISRNYNPKMINTITEIEKMLVEYKNSDLINALISRSVNISFTILMMIPIKFSEQKIKIESFITENRLNVIKNPQTKPKVKIAILLSFLGYNFVKLLFKLKTKFI